MLSPDPAKAMMVWNTADWLEAVATAAVPPSKAAALLSNTSTVGYGNQRSIVRGELRYERLKFWNILDELIYVRMRKAGGTHHIRLLDLCRLFLHARYRWKQKTCSSALDKTKGHWRSYCCCIYWNSSRFGCRVWFMTYMDLKSAKLRPLSVESTFQVAKGSAILSPWKEVSWG